MPWVTTDDQMPEHPKVWGLSDAAFRLHVSALHYCNRQMTDGVVHANKVRALTPRFRRSALDELTDRGMWLPAANGDWIIHDYLDWNKSRAEIEARREKLSKAGKKGMTTRWG